MRRVEIKRQNYFLLSVICVFDYSFISAEIDTTRMNSSHLFAAEVVQQLDVTGVKRLPCVHRHQHNLVANHHLTPLQLISYTPTQVKTGGEMFTGVQTDEAVRPCPCKHPCILK